MSEPQWPTEPPATPEFGPQGSPPPSADGPPITDAMRATARQQRGGWVYVIDSAFDPNGSVPGWAVAGGYPVDATGEVRPEFTANPGYRPSPRTLGFDQPATDLEGALQLAVTGYGSTDNLLTALAAAEVITPARSEQDTSVAVYRDQEGRSVVPVFSSDRRLPSDVSGWRRMPMADLLSVLPGKFLAIDPGTAVSVTLPGEQIIAAGAAH
jgi:hypothetical protein